LSTNGLPTVLVFSAHPAPDHSLATFADMPKKGSGPISGSEEEEQQRITRIFQDPQFLCSNTLFDTFTRYNI
jgi:hypothetical protein